MSNLENLINTLERLKNHLESIRSGSVVAKDDLATTLHLLVGKGTGYDLISKTFEEIGIAEPLMAGFQDKRVPRSINDQKVVLCIRTMNNTDDFKSTLSELLTQECIYHDSTIWTTSPSLSWSNIISISRNKFGSHVDKSPPAWLESLRYYPAADADIMTLLLWSFGEVLLGSITYHLYENGVDIEVYSTKESLNGVSFQQGELLKTPTNDITLGALVSPTAESCKSRTIFGVEYGERAFILGLNPKRQVVVMIGSQNYALKDLEYDFMHTGSVPEKNRAARRAEKKKK